MQGERLQPVCKVGRSVQPHLSCRKCALLRNRKLESLTLGHRLHSDVRNFGLGFAIFGKQLPCTVLTRLMARPASTSEKGVANQIRTTVIMGVG